MIRLCAIGELHDPGCRGFHNEHGHIFVVRKGMDVYAYQNNCPHYGINLEWQPDQFLDENQCLIQCANHGAQFLIETGECIAGPCTGQYLTALACKVHDNVVYLL